MFDNYYSLGLGLTRMLYFVSDCLSRSTSRAFSRKWSKMSAPESTDSTDLRKVIS